MPAVVTAVAALVVAGWLWHVARDGGAISARRA